MFTDALEMKLILIIDTTKYTSNSLTIINDENIYRDNLFIYS